MAPDQERAHAALSFILPELEKRSLRYVITGGFACYTYGIKRPLTDIDIDIDTAKDSETFKEFYASLAEKMTQPLEHLVDQNYDNYNFEITVDGIIVDICPMAEMKVFDVTKNKYVNFYETGFPAYETVDFFGLKLNLLSKELILKNKEMLRWQRESDHRDIAGLRELLGV
jgi:hypothetical protein